MELIFVYVTCENHSEVFNADKAVVKFHLAVSANVIDGMESIYWWNDKL